MHELGEPDSGPPPNDEPQLQRHSDQGREGARERPATSGGGDAFAHFWEQADSESIRDKYAAHLVQEARAVLREHPDADLAALILMPGSSEARQLLQALAASGHAPPGPIEEAEVTMLAPRGMIESIIDQSVPAMRPLIDARPPDPPWMRTNRCLCVLVATAHGYRLHFVEYDLDPIDEE